MSPRLPREMHRPLAKGLAHFNNSIPLFIPKSCFVNHFSLFLQENATCPICRADISECGGFSWAHTTSGLSFYLTAGHVTPYLSFKQSFFECYLTLFKCIILSDVQTSIRHCQATVLFRKTFLKHIRCEFNTSGNKSTLLAIAKLAFMIFK